MNYKSFSKFMDKMAYPFVALLISAMGYWSYHHPVDRVMIYGLVVALFFLVIYELFVLFEKHKHSNKPNKIAD